MGVCERWGELMYGGRCWQHRPVSAEERALAKQVRVAHHNLDERAAETGMAKRRYDDLREALMDDLIEFHESNSGLPNSGLPAHLEHRVATIVAARAECSRAYNAMERARVALIALEDNQ
jgi:transposase